MRLILRPYQLTFRRPLATGFGLLHERQGIVVGLEAGGYRGWGEAAPLPGFGGELLDHSARMLGELRDEARDWSEKAEGDAIARIVAGLAGRWPKHPCARAAVEQALCDLAARQAGLPLWRWLRGWWGELGEAEGDGGAASVRVNATIGGAAPAEVAAQARAAAAAGFDVLKVKLLGDHAEDLARLRAAREAVGSAVALRADANGTWSLDQARMILAELRDLRLHYVEQPLPPGDHPDSTDACVRGMAELRRLGVPLAADESLLRPGGLRAVLEHEAADHLILKPQLLGGMSKAAAFARAGAERGLGITMTSSLDGAVGVMGVLQLTAALGLPGAHGLATSGLFAADLAATGAPAAGLIRLPTGAGLGLDPEDGPVFSANAKLPSLSPSGAEALD